MHPLRRFALTAPLRSVVAFALLMFAGLVPSQALAAGNRTFTNTYAQTLHGDIAEIGNANSTCNPAWTPSPACDTNSTTLSNSSKGYGVLVDVDGDPTTTNSSRSTVALPTGATVAYARLTWGSTGDNTDDNGEATIKFDTPEEVGLNYRDVSADYATRCGGLNAASANRGTACSADVTSLVQAAGSGQYTVGGIEQRSDGGSPDAIDHWSGWALYIVYEKSDDQLRRIVLSDGFLRVANGVPTSPIALTGFTAPASGPVTARLVYAAGEGDAGIAGDNATINSTSLDGTAPIDLMNSSNTGHALQTSRDPSYANQYGFDMDSQEVNGAIPNGATSATFTFSSTGDTYYPFSAGITIDLDEPNVVLTKSLVDVNGGVVESGDTLEYQVIAENQGDDGATDVVLTDNIPTHTTYVPGSMEVTAGANAGVKTDAAGDDQAVYDSGLNRVAMYLGTGATSATGGDLAIGATTTITFQVVVDPGIGEGVPVTNTANGAYMGQTALFSYANPSTIASTPVRRADLVVAQTTGTLVAGQTSGISLVASNVGGASTHGNLVTLTTSVPADVTFGAITSATGWTCSTASLPAITCTRTDDLAAGSSYPPVEYSVTPSQVAASATFNVSVAGGNETDTSNDTDSDVATFSRSVDLLITNIPNASTAAVGDTITYAIAGRNLGPSSTTGVAVTGTLPTGLQPTTATLGGSPCVIAGQDITCTVGALGAAGPSADTSAIVVTALVLPAASGTTMTFTPSIGGSDPDPSPANNTASASVTITPAADLLLTESVSPSPANVGADVTYTFTATNSGPGSATSVVLTDDLPAGAIVQSITTTQGGCGSGDPFTCNLGTLTSGQTVTITVVVRAATATAGGTLTNPGVLTSASYDPNTANNSASATLTVNPAADLRTTATVDFATATIGSTRNFLLSVTNDGPSAATGAALLVDLPAGATILAATPSQGTCGSGDPRTCTFGALAAGATATVAVEVRIEAANAGNAVTVSGDASAAEHDPTPGNNAASATTNAGDAADLRVIKTADRPTANVGDTITWTITVTNAGPQTALSTTVADAIPAGVTIVSATSTAGSCTVASAISCALGSLTSGASEVITVVGTVQRAAADSPLTAQASVTGSVFDPDTSNNVSAATTTVGPASDLRLVKLADQASPRIGETITWTIQVFNDGPSTANAVHVTDVVPAGAPIDSISATASGCTRTGQSIDCVFASIPGGGSVTVTIVATVASGSGGASLNNSATVTSSTLDPDPSNNTSSSTSTAAGAADLSITLVPDRDTATVGQRITWNGVVGNGGPQTAHGVVVTLEFPEGMTDVQASTPGGTCTVTGRSVTCLVTDVPVGSSGAITISGIVDRTAAEKSLVITGVAAADESDPVPADNTTSGQLVAIAPAVDLRLEKTADRGEVSVGDTLTVTGTVTNRGPSTATEVVVVDYLPEGVDLQSVVSSQGACVVEGNKITCSLGVLADGQKATITTVVVVKTAGAGQKLLSGGSVTSAQFDTDASDNAAAVESVGVTGAVAPAPFIDLTKTVDQQAPVAGDRVVYTITATNRGNAAATAVRVVDALPAGLDYKGTKVTGGTCTRAARTITCVTSKLNPGASMVVKITVVVGTAGKIIENTASVTADGLPSTPANGQLARTSLKASGAPYLFAAIKPSDTGRPGGTISIRVKVTNVGVGTARDARVCFKLPASVVLLRKPAGLTQKGTQFCLSAAALAAGKNKRVVLQARVVGPAGRAKPTITATSANAKTKTEAFAIQVRGIQVTRGSGVTG